MKIGKTYTDFKEWQTQYMEWMDSMPKFYNHKFLAITGIFCNNGSLDDYDAKEFMFPNTLEVDNMDILELNFAISTMMEEWNKKLRLIVEENN